VAGAAGDPGQQEEDRLGEGQQRHVPGRQAQALGERVAAALGGQQHLLGFLARGLASHH